MRKVKLDVYQDAAGAWRWQVQHGNGRILAAGSEGFSNRAGAKRNFKRTRDAMRQITDEFIASTTPRRESP